MMRRSAHVGAFALVLVTGALHVAAPLPRAAALARVPLSFVENRGQVDGPASFCARGRNRSVWFAQGGLTIALDDGARRWSVKLDFVGANAAVKPSGLDPTGATFNWLGASAAESRTGVRAFGRVTYPDLWPGIDATFTGTTDRLKWTFVVRPGADPSRIRFAYRGADDVRLDGGRIVVSTPVGGFDDDAPVAWQGDGAQRTGVSAEFALDAATNTAAFRLGEYDATRPLVIDPNTTVYAGYLGGSGDDIPRGMAMDDTGAVYVTGSTSSSDFPVSGGADTTFNAGLYDVFVAKIRPDGTGLAWATFVGGNGLDQAFAIALDSANNVYITGSTLSLFSAKFPVVGGPGTGYAGSSDAFVTKIDASGTSLVYSFLLPGGANGTAGNAIAVDETGAAYVTGKTDGQGFPATMGSYGGGGLDAFVVKVHPDGATLDWARYLGGAANEYGNGIAVGTDHSVYVGGTTYGADFPHVVGPDLTFDGVNGDGFVTKLSPDGATIVWSGAIGGSGSESCNGVVVDSSGSAWVVGSTTSTDFPAVKGPRLTYSSGAQYDAYVGKVKPDGSAFEFLGFVGDEGTNDGLCIAAVPGPQKTSGTKVTSPSDLFFRTMAAVQHDKAWQLWDTTGGGHSTKRSDIDTGAGQSTIRMIAVRYPLIASGGDSDSATLPVSGGLGPTAGGGKNSYLEELKSSGNYGFTLKYTGVVNAKTGLELKGTIDSGPEAPPSWSGPGSIDINLLPPVSIVVTATNQKSLQNGATLTIRPSPIGSSRATFSVRIKGDLTGSVDPNGPVTIEIDGDGYTASDTVTLTKGSYKAGKVPGSAASQPLVLDTFKATVKPGAANDSLAASFAFGSSGTAPASPPTLHFVCAAGGQTAADFTVAPTSWKPKGSKFTFKGKAPGITSATIDYAKGTISVAGTKLDLTPFAAAGPTFDTLFTVDLGDAAGDRTVEVRTAKKGRTVGY